MKNIFIHSSFEEYCKQYPIILIDVGTSGGIQQIWEPAKRHLRVIGFEPDSRAFENLKKNSTESQKFINTALDSFNGTIKFYMTRKQECSSVFTPNFAFIEEFTDAERYAVK